MIPLSRMLSLELFSAVLQINFGESDYSIKEGFSRLSSKMSLTFRANQNPFSVTLTPVTIDIAENMSLGDFISSNTIEPTFRATEGVCFSTFTFQLVLFSLFLSSGDDFTTEPLVITVPANRRSYSIETFFNISDDNLDEDEQSFAIVAEIGRDVPDGVSCFQIAEGPTECHGRRGATEIRITDNDRELSTIM